ncbi:MAG: WG repeat-containing protein [Saprospiraceae bacterium]
MSPIYLFRRARLVALLACVVFSAQAQKEQVLEEPDQISSPVEVSVNGPIQSFTVNGLMGFKMADGQVLIPAEYESLPPHYNDIMLVKKDGKWGMIDGKNKVLIPLIYDVLRPIQAKPFQPIRNLFLTVKSGRYQVIDDKGKAVFKEDFDTIEAYLDFALVKKNGKTGVLNYEEELLIPMEFDALDPQYCAYLNLPLFPGTKNGESGMYQLEQKTWLPCTYDKIGNFHFDWVLLHQGDKTGAFRLSDLSPIIDYKYTDLIPMSDSSFIAENEGQFGVVNFDDEVLIPLEHTYMRQVNHNLLVGNADGAYGVLDQQGTVLVPVSYDLCSDDPARNGTGCFKKDGLLAMFDAKTGKQLTPFQFVRKEENRSLFYLPDGRVCMGGLSLQGEPYVEPFDSISYAARPGFAELYSLSSGTTLKGLARHAGAKKEFLALPKYQEIEYGVQPYLQELRKAGKPLPKYAVMAIGILPDGKKEWITRENGSIPME